MLQPSYSEHVYFYILKIFFKKINNGMSPSVSNLSSKLAFTNNLNDDLVIRTWDQEVCFLCSLRFELYGCSYDSH